MVTVRGIGRKSVGLQSQYLFGSLDHHPGRGHLVVGAGRRLHVDDDRILDVDQVVEPVAELNALVGFGGPGRARVHRRDHLRQLAIGVGTFAVKGPDLRGSLSNFVRWSARVRSKAEGCSNGCVHFPLKVASRNCCPPGTRERNA
jgi:hypothetical protein